MTCYFVEMEFRILLSLKKPECGNEKMASGRMFISIGLARQPHPTPSSSQLADIALTTSHQRLAIFSHNFCFLVYFLIALSVDEAL